MVERNQYLWWLLIFSFCNSSSQIAFTHKHYHRLSCIIYYIYPIHRIRAYFTIKIKCTISVRLLIRSSALRISFYYFQFFIIMLLWTLVLLFSVEINLLNCNFINALSYFCITNILFMFSIIIYILCIIEISFLTFTFCKKKSEISFYKNQLLGIRFIKNCFFPPGGNRNLLHKCR